MTLLTLRDFFPSLIRTLVPVAVGLVLARFGISAVEVDGVPLQTLLSVVCVGLYYGGVRLLETRWPKVGVLLGLPISPTYLPQPNRGDPEAQHH